MARAQQEIDDALQDLIAANQRFVAKVAHALRNRAVPFEDLMSEGNLGLIEAARRFDCERGAGFLTYAVFWIRKRMLAAIAAQQSLVRMSDHEARRIRGSRIRGSDLAFAPETPLRRIRGSDLAFAPETPLRLSPSMNVRGAKARSDPARFMNVRGAKARSDPARFLLASRAGPRTCRSITG